MKAVGVVLCLVYLCVSSEAQNNTPGKNAKLSPARFVVVGDSLSAGVQNFSLLDTQQPNGYASIIAEQAGWPISLPLVPFPGAPNVLRVVKLGPPVDIEPVTGSLPIPPRDNPSVQPTNIAIPGLTVSTALSLRPSFTATDPQQQWATLVLGFPNLPRKAPTEIELAISLKPTVLIEWLGNNDALVPALSGQISALTPLAQFSADYRTVLNRLFVTQAKLVTATIPDVTEVPFFTSIRALALKTNLSLNYVTAALGVRADDYIRPSAQMFVEERLVNPRLGPLPANCPSPLPDLGVDTLPCVLTAADAGKVRATVDAYNVIIRNETHLHGGVVVDIHALVDRIYKNGYQVGADTLTTDFFGGLFSLDGIHPTATGYAVIANEFIKALNAGYRMNIPAANIESTFLADPLAKYYQPRD